MPLMLYNACVVADSFGTTQVTIKENMMITSLGKELRKLRIDLGITLNGMAEAINVSPSLLSSVETGKKPAPANLIDRLAGVYEEVSARKAELVRMAEETKKEVRIKLDMENPKAHGVAMAFARSFDSLSDEDLKKMMEIISKRKE